MRTSRKLELATGGYLSVEVACEHTCQGACPSPVAHLPANCRQQLCLGFNSENASSRVSRSPAGSCFPCDWQLRPPGNLESAERMQRPVDGHHHD